MEEPELQVPSFSRPSLRAGRRRAGEQVTADSVPVCCSKNMCDSQLCGTCGVAISMTVAGERGTVYLLGRPGAAARTAPAAVLGIE